MKFDFNLSAHEEELHFERHVAKLKLPSATARHIAPTEHIKAEQARLSALLAERQHVRHTRIATLRVDVRRHRMTRKELTSFVLRLLRHRSLPTAGLLMWIEAGSGWNGRQALKILAASKGEVPMIGEVEEGRWLLMPWRRQGKVEGLKVPAGVQGGVALYEDLAMAYWVGQQHNPAPAEEPSGVVRAWVAAQLENLREERQQYAQARQKRQALLARLPPWLVPSQYGALIAVTHAGTERYRINPYDLPDGDLFGITFADGRYAAFRIQGKRAYCAHDGSWLDVTASVTLEVTRALKRHAEAPGSVRFFALGQEMTQLIGLLELHPELA